MKIRAMALASVVAMLWASVATAGVSFTIIGTSGGDPNNLGVGEQITIDVRIANDGASGAVFGLGASAYDYNDALSFVSGEAVSGYLFDTCIPGTGCFNGLDNTVAGALSESSISPNPLRVQIANSASLTGRTGDGSQDPGLDGVVGGGDTQFQVTFEGLAPGTVDVIFGTGYQGDVVVLEGGASEQAANATLTINVPEPGAVAASLAALGSVAGVVAIRRRD